MLVTDSFPPVKMVTFPALQREISLVEVLIFNQMSDISPSLPALPGSFAGGWYLCDLGGVPHALVGTNNLTISTLFKENLNFPRRGSIEVQPETRRRYCIPPHPLTQTI